MSVGYEYYKDLLNIFLAILKKRLGGSLVSFILYGSVARGDAKEESDIDLIIILTDPSKNYFERLDPILIAERGLKDSDVYKGLCRGDSSPPLNYLIFSKEEALENRYIYLDMIEDALLIYDRDNFFKIKMAGFRKRLEELGSRKIYLEDGSWYWDIKPDYKFGELFEL